MSNQKEYWDNIYQTKVPHELSWTQKVPEVSLKFIRSFNLPKDAAIIDAGGGDSNLVDHLLEEGFTNITVLDISTAAINRARERLGYDAEKVTWIITDITDFKPKEKYDVWHDRATFHFLTHDDQIKSYNTIIKNNVKSYLVIGTFSTDGPDKCSGLDVLQYDEEKLTKVIPDEFIKLECTKEDHFTPFNTCENYIFCSFKKNSAQ